MKKITLFSVVSLMLLASISPTNVVFSDSLNRKDETIQTINLNDSTLNIAEGETVTLQQIVDGLNLTSEQKEQIISESLRMADEIRNTNRNTAFRSAGMSTVIRRLSPAQVKRAANTNDMFGYLTGLIPGVGIPLGALYMLHGQTLRTAADNGWGLEVVFTADPYNPTSTGMSFSWRFVK